MDRRLNYSKMYNSRYVIFFPSEKSLENISLYSRIHQLLCYLSRRVRSFHAVVMYRVHVNYLRPIELVMYVNIVYIVRIEYYRQHEYIIDPSPILKIRLVIS